MAHGAWRPAHISEDLRESNLTASDKRKSSLLRSRRRRRVLEDLATIAYTVLGSDVVMERVRVIVLFSTIKYCG